MSDHSDPIAVIQAEAMAANRSPVAHFGYDPQQYGQWRKHSNRLIPVYGFGTLGGDPDLDFHNYSGQRSAYRSADRLKQIYGGLPSETLNPEAEYMDQTDIFRLQLAAIRSNKKHIFVVIFDGMSWHATRAAAIATSAKHYKEGKGTGLFLLDYQAGGNHQFSFMATAPYCETATVDVARQTVAPCILTGGYSAARGGATPWAENADLEYLVGQRNRLHPYTDSAASASSMGSGIKTYNIGINVRPDGTKAKTICQWARESGYAVGTVTSVPFCHATPAGFAAHNVSRDDYRNLGRDMLGLKSASHPETPLSGLDVVIGAGLSDAWTDGSALPDTKYISAEDLRSIDVAHGGNYVVCLRTSGKDGSEWLAQSVRRSREVNARLFAMFGTRYDHLPFRTSDGDYKPVLDNRGVAESYSSADLLENPTLDEMTGAAIDALSAKGKFWLMVEAGDVDWAKHWNSIDNMIGAIVSGDLAIERIAAWVDRNSNWNDSVLIATSDHGHAFVLQIPEAIAGHANRKILDRAELRAGRSNGGNHAKP